MAQTGAIELLKLLNKYLLMVTYEYGENYSIRFEIGPLFYSIQNEKKHYLHSTNFTAKWPANKRTNAVLRYTLLVILNGRLRCCIDK